LSGRALAAAILGWSLVKVVAKLLFTKQQPGLELFVENYGAEGLGSLDGDERDAMERFSRCIACGRCDVGEADRIQASNGAYPGLMQLVLASSRNMPDFDAARLGFAHVPVEVLRDKEKRCPVRIPFAQLAAFVEAHAQDASGSAKRLTQ
jgi:hypothetical protein